MSRNLPKCVDKFMQQYWNNRCDSQILLRIEPLFKMVGTFQDGIQMLELQIGCRITNFFTL